MGKVQDNMINTDDKKMESGKWVKIVLPNLFCSENLGKSFCFSGFLSSHPPPWFCFSG